ncbi:uncharacterized protein TRUGW13939_08399 [Talaromyces rugulosus]|uniref:Uncharacterized protein n=1 Tax=Talaromyces rugulosus TaxID=121627 RepID=A0A7H8R6A6_TALRU|nr:uncharacterized protein TRUGW13939_08399 [Talaromyces rugulosus]QKX61251.1 hypothetical protein TRUGW13939_08399 [Talaromyces rugulosus]
MDPAGGGLPTEDINNQSAGLGSQGLASSANPHASVDDYNRVMLQYTQRQLAAFTTNSPSARRSSATSGSSGPSNSSSVTNIARTGSGIAPRASGSSSYSSARS